MSSGTRLTFSAAGADAMETPDPWLVKLRDFIYQTAGIFQPDHKFRFLHERCGRRMIALKHQSFRQYYEYVSGSARMVEVPLLLNEITVGETCFFRNPSQLDAMRKIALPKILQAREKLSVKKLRIWSAGCSTGEEPYTLAMMLLSEPLMQNKGYDFEVMATDLNERSIASCQQGIYDNYAVRNTPPDVLKKYFKPNDGRHELSAEVKAKVKFQRVNLLEDARMLFLKSMDIVFCCNVLIYFDNASKQRVISHFFNNLLEHGYLLLGHAESLYGISDAFQLVHFPSATGYIKASRSELLKQAGKS